MRAKLMAVLVVCCGASALVPGTALADTLDQQQPDADADIQVQNMESEAQTFTAGLTGGLDRVELFLGAGGSGPDAPLTVDIRDVSAGSPGTTVLATGSVPASAVSSTDAWVPITFGAAAPVTAGSQYSIVAYSSVDGTHQYDWGFKFANPSPYPAGTTFFTTDSPPGSTWTMSVLIGDHAFKTYVEVPPSSTPPATGPTGKRAAAKKRCKKKFHKSAKKRKKCLRKARRLPV